jgi:hypothetical protein
MGLLNIFKSQDQTLMLMQKQWSSQLNPLLSNIMTQGAPLPNITLAANTPLTFNHYLGKQMTGWFIIDNTSYCEIKRTQPLNSTTLTLESSAATTIALWVF